MAIADDARGKMDDAQAQLVRLREQVETLMKDRVTPAVSDFADRAGKAAHSASDSIRDQAQGVSSRVKDQPLMAIAIAAVVGWIIGRITR